MLLVSWFLPFRWLFSLVYQKDILKFIKMSGESHLKIEINKEKPFIKKNVIV